MIIPTRMTPPREAARQTGARLAGRALVTALALLASLQAARAEGALESGEFAVEYLKRVSRVWRFVAAVEGESDEVELILEAQARLNPHVLLKLNSGFGVTSKAADFAPEVGVLFSW